MRFEEAIFFLTIDDTCAGDRILKVGLLALLL